MQRPLWISLLEVEERVGAQILSGVAQRPMESPGLSTGAPQGFYQLGANELPLRQGFGGMPKHLCGAERRPICDGALRSWAAENKEPLQCSGPCGFPYLRLKNASAPRY